MKPAQTLHRLRYFASDAWDEWRHSPGVNLLAVATLTSVLFLAGLAMVVYHNVQTWLEQERREIRVEVYLQDSLDDVQRLALRRELEAEAGVARVAYIDKEAALQRFEAFASDAAALIGDLGSNPLPASLEAYLEPGPGAEITAEQIRNNMDGRPGVDSVRFDRDLMSRLQALLDVARVGGAGLGLIVFTAVIFVMASVLRLAVYARRDEIEIMLLVGATPAFVRGPFLVAGLAQGAGASLLALGVVEGVRRWVLARSEAAIAVLDLVAYRPLPLDMCVDLVGLGLLVSLTGSYFAVRRPV
jgi:cell division transport system permease protein